MRWKKIQPEILVTFQVVNLILPNRASRVVLKCLFALLKPNQPDVDDDGRPQKRFQVWRLLTSALTIFHLKASIVSNLNAFIFMFS